MTNHYSMFTSGKKIIGGVLLLMLLLLPNLVFAQASKLKVITDPNAKPMVFYNDKTDRFDGFEYEIMSAIAKEMGLTLEIVAANYDDFIEYLKSRKGDMIMGGFIPSDEYANVSYSSSYLEFGLCLVVKQGSPIRSLADLKKKKVGFYDDQGVKDFLQEQISGDYTYIKYNDLGYFDDLDQGRLDAFLYDFPYAFYEIKPYQGRLVIISKDLTNFTYNIALRKADQQLKTKIDNILYKLGTTGVLSALKKKWFDISQSETTIQSETLNFYVVQYGDSLSTIAARFNMSWQILHKNNYAVIGHNPNLIFPGMRLVVAKPAPSGVAEAKEIYVYIDSKPQGASVYINKKIVPGKTTPMTIPLPEGKVDVMFKKQGYDSWMSPVDISDQNKIIFAPLQLSY